jgi:hypothetical protein
MNAETREIIGTELKRFAADLNLSEAQKAQLCRFDPPPSLRGSP